MNRRQFLVASFVSSLTALTGCLNNDARNIRLDIISQYTEERQLMVRISKNSGEKILFEQDIVVAASPPSKYTRIETSIDPGVSRGSELDIEVIHNGQTQSSSLTLDCPQDEAAGDGATIRIDIDGAVKLYSNQCYTE